jgi:hypothetical protein
VPLLGTYSSCPNLTMETFSFSDESAVSEEMPLAREVPTWRMVLPRAPLDHPEKTSRLTGGACCMLLPK